MRFYDTDPFNHDAMMGWAPESTSPGDTYDMAVVMSAPTPRRGTTRGNIPIGKMSDQFLRAEHGKYFDHQQTQALKVYWTYLVKTPVKFKKKPPISKIRAGTPALIQELRLVLQDTTQPSMLKSLVECPYCHATNELGNATCSQCGAPLGGIKPYIGSDVRGRPRVLVQGNDVAKALCPGFKTISDDHGAFFFNEELGAYVIPTFDFWSMRYDPVKEELIARDLERFWTLPDPQKPDYEIVGDFVPTSYLDPIVLDIETTGLDSYTDEITMIGYKNLWYDEPVKIVENPTKHQIENFLHNIDLNRTLVVAHNGQFDINFTTHFSHGQVPRLIHDTMLMAFVGGEQPLNLKHLTTMHTDRPGPRAFGGTTDHAYLAEDVLSTEALYEVLAEKYGFTPALNLLHEILPRMIEMRQFGVYIDPKKYNQLLPEFKARADMAMAVLNRTAKKYGFETDEDSPDCINYNSPPQVVDLLLKAGVPLRERTSSGNFSASEPVLQSLQGYGVIDDLLDYRFYIKQLAFLESYEEFLKHDGFLHPRMMLHGTETGRLSCRDPNLQQVPRVGSIKEMFVSRWGTGYIGLIDLAQAELRVTALLADDDMFAEALLAEDVHRKIASMVFGKPEEEITSAERKASKAITFGLLYGGSDKGLATRAGLPVQQVTFVRQSFLSTFSGVNRYLETTKNDAIRTGWVESPLGRRRNIRHVYLREGEHGAGRKATNTPIQGTASDIMLFINNEVTRMLEAEFQSRPIFGVHDSTVLDIHPKEVDVVGRAVQQAFINLDSTPLADFPLFNKLPVIGELILGKSWAHTESTNEAYKPEETLVVQCSSHAHEYAEFYTPEPKAD